MNVGCVKPKVISAAMTNIERKVTEKVSGLQKVEEIQKHQRRHFDLHLEELFDGNLPINAHSTKFRLGAEHFINSLI